MFRKPSSYLLLLCAGLNALSLNEKGVANNERLIVEDRQSIGAGLDALPRVQPTSTIEHKRRVDLVLFFPDNNYLASVSVGEDIKITNPDNGMLLRVLSMPGYSVRSMGFSHDGAMLAVGTNTGQVDLWDMRTYQLRDKIPVTRWNIDAVALSPDSRTLASCGGDGTVQLWDMDTTTRKHTLSDKDMPMSSLVFSSDSSLLATLNIEGKCSVWEIKTGKLINTIERAGDGVKGKVIFLAAKKIAIVTRLKVTFWNPIENTAPTVVSLPDCIDPDKQEVARLSGPRPYPLNAISKDCNIAASRLEDGSIVVWMVESRTVKCILVGDSSPGLSGGGIRSIAFSLDSRSIASGNENGKVHVWNIEEFY